MRRLAALLLVLWATPALAQSVPVMAGGDAEYDACGAVGLVRGLDPQGDGFLAVRAGPGTKYRMLGKLYNGQTVHLCDRRGPWIGVVYVPGGLEGCGVTTPWISRLPYTGPCRHGWVHGKWVLPYAG